MADRPPLDNSFDAARGETPPDAPAAREPGATEGPVLLARPVFVPEGPPPPPAFGEGISRRRAFWELAFLVGLFWCLQVVMAVPLILSDSKDAERYVNLAGAAVMGIAFVVSIAVMLRAAGQTFAAIGWRSSSPPADLAIGIGFTYAVFVVLFALTLVASAAAPELFRRMEDAQKNIEAAFPRLHPAGLLGITMWIALYEEVVFRGFLLTRLKAICGSWTWAVLLGSALFAVLHGYQGGFGIVLILLLGLTLSCLFVWRKSLLPPVTLHFLFNAAQFLQLYYLSDTWQ